MAFFSIPSHPVAPDIADAFALAMLSGLMAQDSSVPLSAEQALAQVLTHVPALRRRSGQWERTGRVGAPLQCAVVLSSACLAGLVQQGAPLEECLLKVDALRPSFLEWGERLAEEATPECCAVLLGGVLRGLVIRGATLREALQHGRVHGFTCSEEVKGVHATAPAGTEDPGVMEAIKAAVQVLATSMAGLVGRGSSVESAFQELEGQRSLILTSAHRLVSAAGVGGLEEGLEARRSSFSPMPSGPGRPRR